MTTHRSHLRSLRYATVTCATWLALPSMAFLAFAACAESNDTVDLDAAIEASVIPLGDSGDEASLDASTSDSDVSVVPCGVGNICSAPTALTLGFITAINGRSKNDVWASGSQGLLMHYDGSQWSSLEFPPDAGITETLSSLFLTADETWGVAGSLVMRRGLDPSSVRLARGNPSGDADYACGITPLENGEIYVSMCGRYYNSGLTSYPLVKLNFNTSTFSRLSWGPVAPLHGWDQQVSIRASFLVPGKALWQVGDRSIVARYPIQSQEDGGIAGVAFTQGSLLPIASGATLFAAWGHDEHLWAAGANGTILHFDGVDWHTENTGTTATLRAIFGLSPNDIWAAGDDGTVLHFDGNAWSSIKIAGYDGDLQAIWASASDDVWIGGESGMFHWGALP